MAAAEILDASRARAAAPSPNGEAPTPDVSIAANFLSVVTANADGAAGKTVIWWQDQPTPDGYPTGMRFFGRDQIADAAEYACTLATQHNVYYGPNLLDDERIRARGRSARGNESEVTAVTCLHMELDAAKPESSGNYPTRAHLFETLGRMPIEASAAVGSGSEGLHVYWLLDIAWRITDDRERDLIKDISRGWHRLLQRAIGTDETGTPYKVDPKFSLEAVLRVPGTLRRRPSGITLVQPIVFEPDRRYSVQQLKDAVERSVAIVENPLGLVTAEPQLASRNGKAQKQTAARRVKHDRRFELAVAAMLRMNMSDANDGSRRLYAACCRAVEYDLADSEALAAVRAYEGIKPFPKAWRDAEILARLRDAEKVEERGEATEGSPAAESDSNAAPNIPGAGDGWQLTVVDSQPKEYRLNSSLWSGFVSLTSAQFLNPGMIRRQALEQKAVFLPKWFAKKWEGGTDETTGRYTAPLAETLVQTATHEEAPPEVRRTDAIRELVMDFFARHCHREVPKSDLAIHLLPVRVDGEGVYFVFGPLWSHLAKSEDKVTRNELSAVLKDMGAVDYSLGRGNEKRNVKLLPTAAVAGGANLRLANEI